jgi:hypothetical protein
MASKKRLGRPTKSGITPPPRENRIDDILMLMESGKWLGAESEKELAQQWGIERSTVQQNAYEAENRWCRNKDIRKWSAYVADAEKRGEGWTTYHYFGACDCGASASLVTGNDSVRWTEMHRESCPESLRIRNRAALLQAKTGVGITSPWDQRRLLSTPPPDSSAETVPPHSEPRQ